MHIRILLAAQATTLVVGVLAALPAQQSSPAVQLTPAAQVRPAAVAVRPVARAVPAPRKSAAPRPVAAPARPKQKRVHAAAPAPKQAQRRVAPAPVIQRVVTIPTLTPQQRLAAAVARIPGYAAGDARWQLRNDAHWGTADWYNNTAYISTQVPAERIFDVVTHEWSHLLSVKAYNGDVSAAVKAMNAWFGGSNLEGAERAADCMARALGAQWTHYTSCTDAHGREGARKLLARQPL